MRLEVSNLSWPMTTADLYRMFSQFGEVANVNLICDKVTGRSKGFAYVDMPEYSQGWEAIKALSFHAFHGHVICVEPVGARARRGYRRAKLPTLEEALMKEQKELEAKNSENKDDGAKLEDRGVPDDRQA